MTMEWMPETNTAPLGLAPEASAEATSTVPLLMPTLTTLRPCAISAATASAALDGDVVMMVRMPAPLNRPSFRTRKSPGTMPLDPGISTATLAAAAGLVAPRQANKHTLASSTLRGIETLHHFTRGYTRCDSEGFASERFASERRLELEMVEAVDRLNVEVLHRIAIADVKPDHGAGPAFGPDLAVEVGQARGGLAVDADDHVAALDTGLVGRSAGRHAANHQAPVRVVGVHAKPRPSRPRRPPLGQEIAEDRRQPIDRHEHIAGVVLFGAGGVADDQRADADELALAVDQCGPAPGRMRRRGVDRLVEQIFPVADELALADHERGHHHVGAATSCDHHDVFLFDVGDLAERERLDLEWLDRAKQAKTSLVIIADYAGRDGAPVVGDDLGRIGLDHQVADRQDEPVGIDQNASALAIAPEPLHSAALGIDMGLDLDHRRDQILARSGFGRGGGAQE